MMGIGSSGWRPWVLDRAAGREVLATALDRGVNLFDTSNFYSYGESERVLGEYLRSVGKRESAVIATKVGNRLSNWPNHGGYSRKHIVAETEASLDRLKTDYIDLLQTHIWDNDAEIDEVLETFELLRSQGKVLYAGFTNLSSDWVRDALEYERRFGRRIWSTLQLEYNALRDEVAEWAFPICTAARKGVLAYGPYARGFLTESSLMPSKRAKTDNYRHEWYGTEADRIQRDKLVNSGEGGEVGSVVWAALTSVLDNPTVTSVLVGATDAKQLDESVCVVDRWCAESERNGIVETGKR